MGIDIRPNAVLLPYRFTLFSNERILYRMHACVLLPYRFTLFSNINVRFSVKIIVLLPYRFTLFSNDVIINKNIIKFYYLIDLHYSQTY